MSGAAEMRELAVAGARLAYADAGEGEVVVLLHGYPQNHATWRHHIGPLAETHRVIAPDWFGWGRSERSERLSTRYHDEVERIGLLLDELGLSTVNLIGHDYGGFLGIGFAMRHPRRVRRFGILNSRAHATFPWPWYIQFGLLSYGSRFPLLRRLVESLPLAAIHRRSLATYVSKGCFGTAELDDYVGWMDTPAGRRWFAHFFAGYEVRVRPDLGAGLSAIGCPVAAIWGGRDPYCPLAIARDLVDRIPGARLQRLDGDHYIMEERPTDVLRALRDLLARPTAL